MANYNPKTEHLQATQWKAGQSGNPDGKPKGTKHLSTWIKEMMEDDHFEYKVNNTVSIKGAPIHAILTVLVNKAIRGDLRAFELIAKYGYGTKHNDPEDRPLPTPILVEFMDR